MTLKPNGFAVLFCSNSKVRKEVHLNFKIKSSGEAIFLSDSGGNIIDSIPALTINTNCSIARIEDGYGQWQRTTVPTPNQTNQFKTGIVFEKPSGTYLAPFYLTLKSLDSLTIRYTLNGSEPTVNSPVYIAPLHITERLTEPDIASFVKTGAVAPDPGGDSFKGNIIRAAQFINGKRVSKVFTQVYFILENQKQRYGRADIISVSSDYDNLFDSDIGIYVAGQSRKANYSQRGRAWERPAHLSIINSNGQEVLNEDIGIRIHGATSRKKRQKSLRIYARKEYGARLLNYSGFSNTNQTKFNRLVLRNLMSGWQKTLFKDELTNYICRNLNFDWLDYKPAVVFLNGEYWGVHHLREHFDKYYVSNKYGCDKDSVNIVAHGDYKLYFGGKKRLRLKGNGEGHFALYDYIYQNNLNDSAAYAHVSDILDIPAIIDFYCAQFYFGNTDYLENNNKLWSYGSNGQWHPVFFDLDGAWDLNVDNLKKIMSENGGTRSAPYSTYLFRSLMKSSIFKKAFLERFKYLLLNDFSSTTVLEALELFKTEYKPIVKEHIRRWSYPGSVRQWERKLNYLESFATHRTNKLVVAIRLVLDAEFDLKP